MSKEMRFVGLAIGLLIVLWTAVFAADVATIQDLWELTLAEGYNKQNVKIVYTWDDSNLTKAAAIPTAATTGDYCWTLTYGYSDSEMVGLKISKAVIDATQIANRDSF